LKLNDFTYKINYCNMITLVKEFTKKIYASYHIDVKTGMYPSHYEDLPTNSSPSGSSRIRNSLNTTTPVSILISGVTATANLTFWGG
jgi:hypothetical protein